VTNVHIFDSRANIRDREHALRLPNGFIAPLGPEDSMYLPAESQPSFCFELLSKRDVSQTQHLTLSSFHSLQGHLIETQNLKRVYVINPLKSEWTVIDEHTKYDTLQWYQDECLSPEEMSWVKLHIPSLSNPNQEELTYEEFKTWYTAQE
jgi:hypothetical protein